MHGRSIHLILFAFLAILAAPAFGRETLCKKDEINYSSCRSGSRIISLCASKDLNGQRGYMHFRYGRPGHIELAYPDKPQHPKAVFFGKQYTFTDGAEYRLTFKANGITYAWFDNTVWPSSKTDGGITHGLILYRNGKVIKELPCVNPTATVFKIEGEIFGDGDLSAE